MNKTYDKLFKIDSKGKVREWWMEQSGNLYRTFDGIQGGKIKSSDWRAAEATNVGKSNERNAIEQATFEINSKYADQLSKKYHTHLLDAQEIGSKIFECMLADKYKTFPGDLSFGQPKLDGMRCIATRTGLWSRAGKPILWCEHIIEELAPHFEKNPNLIIDGELYNHELREDFNEIMSLVKKKNRPSDELYEQIRSMVQYHMYDLPSHPGTFRDRHNEMVDMFGPIWDQEGTEGPLRLVTTICLADAAHFDDLHGSWLEQGFEGSMWRANTRYENKRTKALLKRKEFQDKEFELIKIMEGKGNWAGVAKVVFFKNPGAPINPGDYFCEDDNVLQKYSDGVVPSPNATRVSRGGIKGSRERAKQLLHEEHSVVTIKFFNLTPDGVPRFPVAIQFHGDKREY